GQGTVKQASAELASALEDDSPYVAIAAAYALGKYGNKKQQRTGVDRLVEIAPWNQDTSVFVAMAALNALDKLDGKAAHALAAIKMFPVGGGASPNGRYNGYVKNLKAKTLKDLGVANNGGKKNRGQRNQKNKTAAGE
ncbi:MAG: HEAT repeat domain-containing protein, partial [Planctomycetota bacterium]|nr:HEAT repeat domain-containing protein [Planctomycetota bacterium]